MTAQLLKFTGVAQKLHQFGDLFLGLFNTGHVCEGHLDLVFTLQLGLALAKRHRAAAAATTLHLAHEIDPQADQQKDRNDVDQQIEDDGALLGRFGRNFHVVLDQVVDEPRIRHAESMKLLAVDVAPLDGIAFRRAANPDFSHRAVAHVIEKIRIGEFIRCGADISVVIENGHQHQQDDAPGNYIF